PAKKAPAKKTPAKKTPAKKTATKTATTPTASRTTVKAPTPSTEPSRPASAPAGSGWTAKELRAVGKTLEAELSELRTEYDETMITLSALQQTVSDGSGDDQADAGSKTFEREHEMSLANNRLDLITQIEHALVRIADGSYGRCESCGQVIAKARLQAFPSATLCLTCKQREERR
ncbi:MAG: TraR/DksA C4-type zinc finger protein, partial [Actinomycetota bacterium]|nr:TraR/DksA C4-type zinc finger protein [Actinomycetota bacterium]